MLTIIADKMLTRVAPYSNLRPNLATTFPCSSFNPFTAPEIMPIEEKLAKETRKTEIIPTVRGERLLEILLRSIIATNSFVTSFVAIMLPVATISELGTPIRNAIGAKDVAD